MVLLDPIEDESRMEVSQSFGLYPAKPISISKFKWVVMVVRHHFAVVSHPYFSILLMLASH